MLLSRIELIQVLWGVRISPGCPEWDCRRSIMDELRCKRLTPKYIREAISSWYRSCRAEYTRDTRWYGGWIRFIEDHREEIEACVGRLEL